MAGGRRYIGAAIIKVMLLRRRRKRAKFTPPVRDRGINEIKINKEILFINQPLNAAWRNQSNSTFHQQPVNFTNHQTPSINQQLMKLID